MRPDETVDFWRGNSHDDLAMRCAVLHEQRRILHEKMGELEVTAFRNAVSQLFVRGSGIEVGAGSRPFPIPDGVSCYYGDIRNDKQLGQYFKTTDVSFSGYIDAQTLSVVPHESLDFVISAHVIEHLFDPVGAICETIQRLRPSGVFIVAVPEMTKTWDRDRPPTSLEHVIYDSSDGGAGTKFQAYLEHCRYVHPVMTGETISEEKIEAEAHSIMNACMDVHVHAWRKCDFEILIEHVAQLIPIKLEASLSVSNENIFVLRKM